MKQSFGAKSILLFVLSILFLFLLTLFESSLVALSTAAERIISLVLLVLPGVIGVIYGVRSIIRKESRMWMAAIGILLNGLFALFHLIVLLFAG
jgi:hypothetical protein